MSETGGNRFREWLETLERQIASLFVWSTAIDLKELSLTKYAYLVAIAVPAAAGAIWIFNNFISTTLNVIQKLLAKIPIDGWSAQNAAVIEWMPVALPSSLLILYLSALLYSLAGFLVDLGCPWTVKRCRTYDGYIQFMDSGIAQLDRLEASTKVTLPQRSEDNPAKVEATPPETPSTETIPNIEHMLNDLVSNASTVQLSSSEAWHLLNRTRLWLLRPVLMLFGSSVLLAAYFSFVIVPFRVFRAL